MSLIPTQTLTLDQLQGYNVIPSSNLLVTPFTLAPLTGLMLEAAQISETQDYSIRLWVSLQPYGGFLPTSVSFFHLNRRADYQVIIYDMAGTLPVQPDPVRINVFPLALPPGDYYFNFLNLVNAENIFSFSSSVIQV